MGNRTQCVDIIKEFRKKYVEGHVDSFTMESLYEVSGEIIEILDESNVFEKATGALDSVKL